jgi:two-component system, chemotaxis family, CheB/CheR fusion protein
VVPMPASFPVVCVGASAGGLRALLELFERIPAKIGAAFVVVQHLDPSHSSGLADALAKVTPMKVLPARNGARVQKDRIYVLPAAREVSFSGGKLRVVTRSARTATPYHPIDGALSTLARDFGECAIGVILSGTGSDGTQGLRAVRATGGIAIVQDPGTAQFAGMIESAIGASAVDLVLSPQAIAREIARLVRHPYVLRGRSNLSRVSLDGVFDAVRGTVGLDLRDYKQSTVRRRLARRLAIVRLELETYIEKLRNDPEESRALVEDVLVHVTEFFRDGEIFEALARELVPLAKAHRKGAPIRVWAAGCSTGQEVYSLAMLVLESLGEQIGDAPIHIFGSDLSAPTIAVARAGLYSEEAMRGVSAARRARFFQRREDGMYRIRKNVRELCVFVQHDVTRDPPLTKLDVISCRNLLIYLGSDAQKALIPRFHYCLNPRGILLLGSAETVAPFESLFTPIDKAQKLFRRTGARAALVPLATRKRGGAASSEPLVVRKPNEIVRLAEHVLLSRFVPAGAVVDGDLNVVHYVGSTGSYLEAPPGVPQTNIVRIAREGLAHPLRKLLREAKTKDTGGRVDGVVVLRGRRAESISIEVVPLKLADPTPRHFLVLFVASAEPTARRSASRGDQLRATREHLRDVIEEHQRAHDQLVIVNEELASTIEELQSTNEELETTQEELQSTNEELHTVNDELQVRNRELEVLNSDLENLVTSCVVIVGQDRRIRRFTPRAQKLMNIIPSDVGRPIDDIRCALEAPHLTQWIGEVLATGEARVDTVRDAEGHYYRMRVRPYRTADNRVDGAVVSVVDVDALQRSVDESAVGRASAESASRAKDYFLATLSHELRTPLSALLMQAQVLLLGELPLPARAAAEAIERAALVQAHLVDQLLDVSRIITGKLRLQRKTLDVAETVVHAVDLLRRSAEAKRVELVTDIDHAVGVAPLDATRIQQVVFNLVTNAIRFTDAGGSIRVVLRKHEGNAVLEVVDTGVGIDAEFLPHLFDQFSQADSGPTRKYGGLGVGLAIVKHVVEAHGGAVSAASAGRGRGTTVRVVLPLSSRAAAKHPRDATPARLDGLRILVIDDDADARAAVSALVRLLGATVVAVDSGKAGLSAIDAQTFDVMLCDLAMPDEDGATFLARARRTSPRARKLPAIALTAHANKIEVQRAKAAGFRRHAIKPVDAARLSAIVRRVVAPGSS